MCRSLVNFPLVVPWLLIGLLTSPRLTISDDALDREAQLRELVQLNERVVELHGQRRLKEAIPLAERALKICTENFGGDHPLAASCSYNLAGLHRDVGAFAKAEPLYLQALAIDEKTAAPDDRFAAACQFHLANIYVSIGAYEKAEPLYLRVLALYQQLLGPKHKATATTMSSLGSLYQYQGDFEKAKPLLIRALESHKESLGEEHPQTAASRHNLAALYTAVGEYEKAEALHLRNRSVWEKKLGGDHPHVATSLSSLAELYRQMGNYSDAEPLSNRALEIRVKALGPDHADTGTSLNNLATLYLSMGDYAKAEPLYHRALAIQEAKLGSEHVEIASSLNNLASLYQFKGDYTVAERFFGRALAIKEQALGQDHPKTANTLNNIAGLYHSMGNHAKSEPLLLHALAIAEKHFGPKHPETATILNNLAVLYASMGESAKAESMQARSLAICETSLATDHPLTAASLINLAELYSSTDKFKEAELILVRALAMMEKTGSNHPDTATVLGNLGAVYYSTNDYAKSEKLHNRALAIREAALGVQHPLVASSLNHLGGLKVETGRFEEALTCLERAVKIVATTRGRRGTSSLNRSSADDVAGIEHVDGVVCLCLKLAKSEDALAWGERGRAAGLRELLAEAHANADAPLSEKDRRRVAAALAKITATSRSIDALAANRQPTEKAQLELARAEIEYDTLLGELATRNAQFAATQSARGITTREAIASPALDDETAVVTWHSFHDLTWGCVIRRSGVYWEDLTDSVERTEDDRLVHQVQSTGNERKVRLTDAAPHLAELYRTRIQPLEKHLAGVTKLIVMAQDWAAVTPLEMLLTDEPDADERDRPWQWPWLSRKYRISYVPSMTTLDILARQRKERKSRRWERPLLALGDPPFSEAQLAEMLKNGTVASTESGTALALSRALRFDGEAVPPRLPGTRFEAQQIAAVAGEKSLQLLGPDASERKLFDLSASGELGQCKYVHLATHGFIDPDRPELAGLVLARAPADEEYDGVLHMREVFHLKLNADLVVLSACQTGLGKQLGGEGMVGLSTSFFFAGTSTVVMSLWKVDDLATALLMQRFYSNLFKGQAKADALHEAKDWLRTLTSGQLEELVKADENLAAVSRGFGKVQTSPKGAEIEARPFAHPHYWAGFVLTGDPQ